MGAVKKLDRPSLYPGRTIWGKTTGPVAFMGELLPDIHVFLAEQEVIEAVIAFGLPTPTMYADLEAGALQAADRIAELEAELDQARAQLSRQMKVVPVEDLVYALKND